MLAASSIIECSEQNTGLSSSSELRATSAQDSPVEDFRESQYKLISRLCNSDYSVKVLAAIETSLSLDPSADHLLREKANLLRRAGRLSECLTTLGEWCSQSPADNVARELLTVLSGEASESSNSDWFAPAKFARWCDLLSARETAELYDHVLANQDRFVSAGMKSADGVRVNKRKRDGLVSVEMGEFRSRFVALVKSKLPEVQRRLNISTFDLSRIELKLSNHLDGHFFHTHQDVSRVEEDDDHRVISFLFYFHKQPKAFDGGDLLLFDTNAVQNAYKQIQFTRIPCEHNSMVFFPSECFHCVEPVRLDSNEFGEGRFAVGGHVRAK